MIAGAQAAAVFAHELKRPTFRQASLYLEDNPGFIDMYNILVDSEATATDYQPCTNYGRLAQNHG